MNDQLTTLTKSELKDLVKEVIAENGSPTTYPQFDWKWIVGLVLPIISAGVIGYFGLHSAIISLGGELRGEIKVIQQDIKHVQSDLTEVKAKIKELDSRLRVVEQKIVSVEGKIDLLDSRVARIEKKIESQ